MELFLSLYLIYSIISGIIVLYKYNVFENITRDFIISFKKVGVTIGGLFDMFFVYSSLILASPFVFNFYICYKIKVSIIDKILKFKIFVPSSS